MKNASGSFRFQLDRFTVFRRSIMLCAILMSGGNLFIPRLPLLGIMVFLGIVAFGVLSGKINRGKILIYSWLATVMMVSIVWSLNGDPMPIAIRLANFIGGLVLLRVYLNNHNKIHLTDDLRAILLPTVYIGLATFIMASVFPGLFIHLEFGAQRMTTFLGIFNYAHNSLGGANNIRPIGIFWEPGVFAAFLNILFYILMEKSDNYIAVYLTAITIFLTQSTTGIALLGMQITYFLAIRSAQRRIKAIELALIISTLISAPALLIFVQENISMKLTGVAVGSFSARLFDFETALQVVMDNPLLGIGFSDSAYLPYSRANPLGALVLSEQDVDGRFNTNGVMIVIYSIGIPLAIIYLAAIFFQSLLPHRFFFGTMIIIILSSSPIAMTPFFSFLFFNGLIGRIGHNRNSKSLFRT